MENLREMIYVDDLAEACVFFMNKKIKETIINIGTGKDYSIENYVKIIANVIAPKMRFNIKYDKSKPNGTPRKVLNINLAKKYGWYAKSDLKKSILLTYKDYLKKSGLQRLIFIYKPTAGDYCESVIPDPIPNSEVKPFCADGTLS